MGLNPEVWKQAVYNAMGWKRAVSARDLEVVKVTSQDEIDAVDDALPQAAKRIEEIENRIKHYETILFQRNEDLLEAKNAMVGTRKDIPDLQERVTTAELDIATARAQLEQAQAEKKKLDERKKKAQERIDNADKQLKSKNFERRDPSIHPVDPTEIGTAEKKLKELQARKKRAEKKLETQGSIIEEYRQKEANAQDDIRGKMVGTEELKDAKEKYEKAKKQTAEQLKKAEEIKLEIAQLEILVTEADKEFQALDRMAKAYESEQHKLDPDLEHAVNLQQARNQVVVQEALVDDLRELVDEADRELELEKDKETPDEERLTELKDKAANAREVVAAAEANLLSSKLVVESLEHSETDALSTPELESQEAALLLKKKQQDGPVNTAKEETEKKKGALKEKQDTLDKFVRQTEELKSVVEKDDNAQAALKRRQKDYDKLAQELEELQKQNEKDRASLENKPVEDQVAVLEKLNTNTTLFLEGKEKLRKAESALNQARKEAGDARAKRDRAVNKHIDKAGHSSPLFTARKEVESAAKEVESAEETQRRAETEAADTDDKIAEVQRRRQVLKLQPEAQATVEKLMPHFEKLAKKGVPGWADLDKMKSELTEEEYAQMTTLANKFMLQYEELAKAGANMEELHKLYEKVPDEWKPAQLREEEQNWLQMKGWFAEEDREKKDKEEKTRLEKLAGISDKVGTGAKLAEKALGNKLVQKIGGKLLEKVGLHELSEEQIEGLGKVLKTAEALCAQPKKIAVVDKALKEEAKELDPIEQMMADQEFLDAITELQAGGLELTGEVLNLVWGELPGLGIVKDAKAAMKSLTELAERLSNAQEDRRIHEEAKRTGHRGEAAFDQFATRDKHLAARAGVDATIAIVNTAAGIATIAGGPHGAAAGKVMKGVTTVAKVGKDVGVFIVDKNVASKARDLLQKAEMGDGRARAELFRYHPRYAKGLLAVMASEGDPLALACMSNHNLTEEMIRKSSPRIIKRYLMKRFGETDEQVSWRDSWKSVKAKARTVKKKLDQFGTGVGAVGNRVIVFVNQNQPSGYLAALKLLDHDLPAAADVSQQISVYQFVVSQQESLTSSANSEREQSKLDELEKAVGEARQKLADFHTAVKDSNDRLLGLFDKVKKGDKGNTNIKESLALCPSLVSKHLAVQNMIVGAL